MFLVLGTQQSGNWQMDIVAAARREFKKGKDLAKERL